MTELKQTTSHKFENGNTQIELWCFIKENGETSYEKEAHIHSDNYFNIEEDIDEEEYEETLKKLEESDEFKVRN